ncbi:MAG TPA: Tol-Pal system beta propeller repeat protein TolB [Crenotrichaceae bacterium]|nr:Tol-Pal system beta propeller repeat protein TolB [Crenotrichaceae bacterium]
MIKQHSRTLKLLGCLLILWSTTAYSELNIQITGGVEGAIPIAIAPFGWEGNTSNPPLDVASIIRTDLERSGRFNVLPVNNLPAVPTDPSLIKFSQWQALGQENLVIGRFQETFPNRFDTAFYLFDVFSQKRLIGYRIPSSKDDLRRMTHQISDMVYEKLTGEKGVFATHIAYVTLSRDSNRHPIYRLQIADADGYGARSIVASRQPIMSPTWSPDGKTVAYVSFEHRRSEIFTQDIWAGKRTSIASFPGINGAPAWSPDGSKLALTLSKDGNPDIYIFDIKTRQLHRIVKHYAVDTEPAWSPDGQTLVFTSDRGGSPQIYRVSVNGGSAKRVSFQGGYNASADFSPDGKMISLVHRQSGKYHIATLDLSSKQLNVIGKGTQDESPTFAPNGSMVLYATNGGTQLAAVSVDGRVHQTLTINADEVREPAWASN